MNKWILYNFLVGFVVSLPFIIALGFRKKIEKKRRILEISDFKNAGITGLMSFGILTLIIVYSVEI